MGGAAALRRLCRGYGRSRSGAPQWAGVDQAVTCGGMHDGGADLAGGILVGQSRLLLLAVDDGELVCIVLPQLDRECEIVEAKADFRTRHLLLLGDLDLISRSRIDWHLGDQRVAAFRVDHGSST
mgnify:CR=1 FL=1